MSTAAEQAQATKATEQTQEAPSLLDQIVAATRPQNLKGGPRIILAGF